MQLSDILYAFSVHLSESLVQCGVIKPQQDSIRNKYFLKSLYYVSLLYVLEKAFWVSFTSAPLCVFSKLCMSPKVGVSVSGGGGFQTAHMSHIVLPFMVTM